MRSVLAAVVAVSSCLAGPAGACSPNVNPFTCGPNPPANLDGWHVAVACQYEDGRVTGGSAVVPHAATVTVRCTVGGREVSATAMGPVAVLAPVTVAAPPGAVPCTTVSWAYPSNRIGTASFNC
ncbi:MAG TPA: hypothetical protein VNQ77_15250 [Frankiaceae bacterium]|nr:hypothetical protein [Frankiaceae bacterium]